jgi:hypothetical protein
MPHTPTLRQPTKTEKLDNKSIGRRAVLMANPTISFNGLM